MNFFEILENIALVNKLLFFLLNAVGMELMLWMYVTNRHSRPSRWFLVGAVFLLAWMDFDFMGALAPLYLIDPLAQAGVLFSTRAVLALLTIFFAVFYYFSINLKADDLNLKEKGGFKWTHIIVGLFLLVASFTPVVVENVVFDPVGLFAIWVEPGVLYWPYVVLAAISILVSARNCVHNYRTIDDLKKKDRMRFITLGFLVFAFYNFLFNIVIPALGVKFGFAGLFSLFGDYALVVFLGYSAYQTVKDKLFGIKIILVEIFVGLMGASLFVMPFFVDLLWQKVLLMVLFMLFGAFGYLLVRSTISEYREMEILERKVLERTAELESTKKNLEVMNSALAVRVKERTADLERLNQTLEEKVKERTQELQKKINDLETFRRITVGRELRMIELKKEVDVLHQKLESPQK